MIGGFRRRLLPFAVAALAVTWTVVPETFASEPSPTASMAVPGAFAGVSADGPDDVWAVGLDSRLPDHWTTLAEHWDGSAWTRFRTPSPGALLSSLNDVVAISPEDAWAVGESASQIGGVGQQTLIEHWDGTSWARVKSPTPAGTEVYLTGVSAAAVDDVWAVGYYSPPNTPRHTLSLHWNGTTWQRVPTPSPSEESVLEGVTVVGPDDVWAAGYFLGDRANRPPMLLHWNGSSWSRIDPAQPRSVKKSAGLLAISAASPSDIWTTGWSPIGKGYTEHWDGTRWTEVPEHGRPALFGISALTSTDVWAVGGDYAKDSIAVEHWDGTAWRLDESLSPQQAELNGVSAVSTSDVWAVGSSSDSQGHAYGLIEHYDGSGWQQY